MERNHTLLRFILITLKKLLNYSRHQCTVNVQNAGLQSSLVHSEAFNARQLQSSLVLKGLNNCSFILSLTHGISCNPPHANAGDPSEIIREGAGSDARSIDLKVVPCTPHYATNIRAFRYEPHAKASLNMALVNPVCRFAQVSVSLLDVIFNFNWPGRRKIRILAPTCSLCIMAHKTSHKTSYPSSDITHGSFLDHSIQTH